jgi:cell division septum initiation protein DivIVA
MITKEELLVALEDSSRNLYKSNEVFGLALKGLESESTVKRLIQDRDQWRKKHDDLADAREKHRALEAQLKNTIPLQFHNPWEDDLLLTIISLRDERDAFHRLVGELHIEKNCIKTDLENMCKEQEALKSKIDELEEELGSKDDDWRLG